MRREVTDLIGSGLLLAALVTATFGALAPTTGASAAISTEQTASGAERGEMLFMVKGCVACHNGNNIAPAMVGLAERAATRRPGMSAVDYVRESIRTPSAFRVPGYTADMPDLQVSDDELDALVAYLMRSR